MTIKAYAVPKRINYTPSPLEPDDNGVQDLGYRIGTLSDTRPYRLECWRMDDLIMVTIMFSDADMEDCDREDMLLLVENEDLIQFKGSKRSLQAAQTEDDAGNSIWALNIMLADADGIYGQILGELKRYI